MRDLHVRFFNKLFEESNTMKETQAFLRKLKAEKRQSNYEIVKSLIGTMKSSEFKFAKGYLMMLHNTEHESEPIKLFRYITDNPGSTEQEARNDHEKTNKTNFDRTVSTLKKHLSWSLVSEYNTQREDAYSYKWKVTFEIMNNLALHYIVISRQIPGLAYDLLNETISKAKEVEAYRELIIALELKIRYIKARSENRLIARLENELKFYKTCNDFLEEATRVYFDLGNLTKKMGMQVEELLPTYETAAKRLNELFQQTNSDSILYYSLFIDAAVYKFKEDYGNAGKTFQKLNKIIVGSAVLNNATNLGRSALDIANNHVLQKNFDLSLAFCKKAKSHFSENSFNHLQAEFLEFYAFFYSNQFHYAEKKLKGIINNKSYRESEFMVNSKKYLVACTYFAQGKYNEAVNVLIGLEKIWKDTTGWNIGIRTLRMLCYKMLGDHEQMAVEREHFRGLFDRYRHRKGIRERDRIILKIIHEFLKKNSDFKSVLLRKKKLFDLLSTPDFEWKVMSHEMIVFEQWFMCMMNKVPYKLEV